MAGSFHQRLLTATRYALIEQGRNRFALGLLLIFVPFWFYFIGVLIPADAVDFKFWVTGALLHVNGQNLSYLSAGLNALTLIVGFMFFASTHKGISYAVFCLKKKNPQKLLFL